MLHSKRLDQIAIVLSAVCVVHCLTVPLLVAFLPVLAVAAGTGTHFHELMLWLVVPTSVAGFGLGFRVHGRAGLVVLGGLGLAGVAIAALWGHDAWLLPFEATVSVIASLLLGYAHFLNFREVRLRHIHR